MVEIVFHEASLFKKIVESLKGIGLEDITFDCNTDGMAMQGMDSSHTALISIDLPSDMFSTYKCTSPVSLAFNVERVLIVLKSAGPNDGLSIMTDSGEDGIEMQLNSPNDDKSTKFRLKRIDVPSESVAIPEHSFRAKLGLSSNGFSQLVKSLSQVDDSVVVRCNEGAVSFSVRDELMDATTTFNAGVMHENPEEEVEVDVTESCRVSYSLRYLKSFATAAPLSSRVTLSFASRFPLLVEYALNDGGHVRFYLAPKVDEESSDDEI